MNPKKQGMSVSPKGLRKLAEKLEKEGKEICEQFGFQYNENDKWVVGIINRTPEASDTWEIE